MRTMQIQGGPTGDGCEQSVGDFARTGFGEMTRVAVGSGKRSSDVTTGSRQQRGGSMEAFAITCGWCDEAERGSDEVPRFRCIRQSEGIRSEASSEPSSSLGAWRLGSVGGLTPSAWGSSVNGEARPRMVCTEKDARAIGVGDGKRPSEPEPQAGGAMSDPTHRFDHLGGRCHTTDGGDIHQERYRRVPMDGSTSFHRRPAVSSPDGSAGRVTRQGIYRDGIQLERHITSAALQPRRSRIGTRGSGEDPEAAVPWWGGRCHAGSS